MWCLSMLWHLALNQATKNVISSYIQCYSMNYDYLRNLAATVVYCYLLLDIWRTIGQKEIRTRNIQRNLKSHTRAIVYSISMFTIVNKNNNSMFTKASPTKLASQIKVNVCVLKDKQALFFIYESPYFQHQFFMAQFILPSQNIYMVSPNVLSLLWTV
jgi:GTPase SAR1 family protein